MDTLGLDVGFKHLLKLDAQVSQLAAKRQRHKPARVVVESLDFRSPKLSRRMNRLVQNFGRSIFTHCLESLAEP